MRRRLPAAVHLHVLIPDVPLIERQIDAFAGALHAAHVVEQPRIVVDDPFDFDALRQKPRRIILIVVAIAVRRNVIDVVPAILHYDPVIRQIGRHAASRRAARHEFDRRIETLHQFSSLVCAPCILFRRHVTRLPRTVHLVAETPGLDLIRIATAVRDTFVRPVGACGQVTVLDECGGFGSAPRTEIDRHHRLRAELFRPLHKLIGADLIGLDALPGVVGTHRALIARSDTVCPVVVADEVAAGIAHHRHSKRLERFENVCAKASRVAERAFRIVNALINGSSHVLEKTAEDARVDVALVALCVESNGSLHCRFTLF